MEKNVTQALDHSKIQRLNDLFENDNNIENWQQIGAANCLLNTFSIISGGPGTGKTTTVAKFLALHLEDYPRHRVALVAQTGKAAARLKESLDSQIDDLRKKNVSSVFNGIWVFQAVISVSIVIASYLETVIPVKTAGCVLTIG